MKSQASPEFWDCLASLPAPIRDAARTAYVQWRADPGHPSLRFKPVVSDPPIWAVRITGSYRALGLRDGDTIIWYWIGPHDTYDRLIKRGGD